MAVDEILAGASTSESGMLSRLAKEVRGEQQFAAEGGEEAQASKDTMLQSIMVTAVPVTADVEQNAIEALNDALIGP